MKTIISITTFTFFLLLNSASQQADYSQLKASAEEAYAQRSYSRANELYGKVDKSGLAPEEVRWVDFRLSDTSWRAQAGTQTSDETKFERAQKQLEELIRTNDKEDDRDLVWAEAHESLGDFFWTRQNEVNWGLAWPHYDAALNWWAGQRDLEKARTRYLTIVLKAADYPRQNEYESYSYYGNYIPLHILENALKISQTDTDKVHLHFLIAMTMRNTGGDWESRLRVADDFEAALKGGKQNKWYDDALYYYAEWMTNNGNIRQLDNGQWQQEPDFIKALELYRRIVKEFTKGETRYFDEARQRITSIIEPTLSVGVANVFLPGSENQFLLNARNLKRVEFSIYKINLTRDVRFARIGNDDEGEVDEGSWIQKLPTAGRVPVKTWSKVLNDQGDHKPIAEEIRVNGRLPIGAYLLEARSGSLTARDLLLVSDVSLVLKSSGTQALVFFSNALTGAPVANANVALWMSYYRHGKTHWRRLRQTTNSDGLAPFALKGIGEGYGNLFATASSAGADERQAFSVGYTNSSSQSGDSWRIYAFTDRPAYRPKETVQWKFIARRMSGGAYSTPANQVVEYQVIDPRGTKVSEGKATLNAFGSYWTSLELGEQLPLGEYRVQFWDQGRANSIGTATLFRLEEYKLPEFKVAVNTPEQDGKKKSFRLGEKVEVNIQADYYFGGPVSNASVEVVVYQKPFYHYWYPRRDYPWYYQDLERPGRDYYGQGSVIKRETIKTDATGKATLTFETPRENYNQDFEYRVEARVTDSSRREIIAADNVRVTRQRYYVYPRPAQNIYRPKDKVTVDIKAVDANEQPVMTQGVVKVTRDYWWEIWIDPSGREVKGEELRLLREKPGIFPPVSAKGLKGWKLKFRGYQHDDILTRTLKTDSEGEAHLEFNAEREGYYRVSWQSPQNSAGVDASTTIARRGRVLPPITAETSVFVATNATTELGYRHQGVQLIIDKDTFRAGQTAPVMLSVPTNDRYVLFSVEADDLYSYQLVHVTGTAKLLQLPIEEKHVPNIFLHAAMVSDAQLFVDSKQVVVPPAQQFLSVEVKADREQYQPREEGTLAITTKDVEGRPVAAEVALGLVDESVKYIQHDYAIDPRQFYYGTTRGQAVQTQSTFNQKAYAKWIESDTRLIDERAQDRAEKDRDDLKSPNERLAVLSDLSRGAAGSGGDTVRFRIDGTTNEVSSESFTFADARAAKSLYAISPGLVSGPPPPPGQEPAVQVRNDFRSTILWQPELKTDASGYTLVKVKYPDSLTTWQATARVATAGNQFGVGNSSTRTKQPLIVRLQAPRFFVVGDRVTVSAVINNNTDRPMNVRPTLNAQGLTVSGMTMAGNTSTSGSNPIHVEPNSEQRVDWQAQVTHASEAKLKVEARGEQYADAMEKSFVIYEHGIEKFLSRSGKMRGESVAVSLEIPRARRPETTQLTVQLAPSMATTMLDALPYLIDYPYGCTEQTMSRFLPAAITTKTLRDLGMKPETAMNKIFGGIESSSAAATHPKGKHDLSELDAITRQSLERLYNFQHADGGWGWWKEGDSDHFMSAYVLWGMTLARQAGIDVKVDSAGRAASYLDKELVEEESNHDAQAWMLHALATYQGLSTSDPKGPGTDFQRTALDNLWTNRDKLNAYTRALLALAAHKYGDREKARTLVANLENGVKIDNKPDVSIVQPDGQGSDPSVIATAHWGEDGIFWRWSDGGVEATSFAFRALLAIDPNNKLIEPVTNWLIKNRRGSQWSNTRDTAIVVLTLNDYLRTSGEVQPQLGYELLVNDQSIATKQLTADDALSAPGKFEIPRELIRDGRNEISIRRTSGSGPIYFSVESKFFSLEEPIAPAGKEIFVRRQYFKLVNHPTLLKGIVSERVPLNDGETVQSGERVETVLTIEAKNNYEYLLFEDLKPAGLEAVQIRSGEGMYVRELKSGALSGKNSNLLNFKSAADFTGRSRWVYQELRDRKVALFIDKLPEGVWQMSYEMRAETPGAFHALPVLGHAMYVPEIRTNGAETRIRVID